MRMKRLSGCDYTGRIEFDKKRRNFALTDMGGDIICALMLEKVKFGKDG